MVHGKGHSEADEFVVIANHEARNAISDYLADRSDSAKPLFITARTYDGEPQQMSRRTLQRIISGIFSRAGVANIGHKTMHSIRHTAITNAIMNGASLIESQAMARHSDPATTQVYFHNINRQKDAAERRIDYNKSK